MIDDEWIQRLGLQLFEIQVKYTPTITDFIQFGGIDHLKKINLQFAKNDFLGKSGPAFLKRVLGKPKPLFVLQTLFYEQTFRMMYDSNWCPRGHQ